MNEEMQCIVRECIVCKKDMAGIFGEDRGLLINNYFFRKFPTEVYICRLCCCTHIVPVISGDLSLPALIKLVSSLMKGLKNEM